MGEFYGNVLIVYEEVQSSSKPAPTAEETEKRLTQMIDPNAENWYVAGRRRTKDGKVLLRFAEAEKSQMQGKKDKLIAEGFKVREPSKRMPRLKIFDVPVNVTEKDLEAALTRQVVRDLGSNVTGIKALLP